MPEQEGTRFPTRLGARKRCSDTRRFRRGFLLRSPLQASWNPPAIPQKTHVSIELQHGRPTGASIRFPEAISSFSDDAERLPFARNSGSIFRRAPHRGHLWRSGPSSWHQLLRATHYALKEANLPTRHDDIHVPMIYDRTKFLERADGWSRGLVAKSVYGNRHCTAVARVSGKSGSATSSADRRSSAAPSTARPKGPVPSTWSLPPCHRPTTWNGTWPTAATSPPPPGTWTASSSPTTRPCRCTPPAMPRCEPSSPPAR